jgi:dolichol-phosphate mannosyltransferase
MVVVLVLSGVQMMMLGVIGEYLWRNIDESRKRPLYFVEKKTTKKNN